MATTDLEHALTKYSKGAAPYYAGSTLSNNKSRLLALQKTLDQRGGPRILEDWILPQFKKDYGDTVFELLKNVTDEFDKTFSDVKSIGNHRKSSCKSALVSFTKYILGQSKANLYMALRRSTGEYNCKLVAQNALFCTVEVATAIKEGRLGSSSNKTNGGNAYYSWFCCGFQRRRSYEEAGKVQDIPSGMPNPQGTGTYVLDRNVRASQAIKSAVISGLPKWLKASRNDFKEYMACHIWDDTCHDYRYHTSMFNLVLLPTTIAGLADYCDAVKELLRYEAAMRFGVYPEGHSYQMSKETKSIYEKLHNDWRQPDEHQIAINYQESKKKPKELK